jgi:hypothetical protein
LKDKIELYRNNQLEKYLTPINATVYQTLMGVFYIELEMVDVNKIQLGDEIKLMFNGEKFTFIVTEINERTVHAEHKSYILRNYVVIDKFFNEPATYDTDIEFADVSLNTVLIGFLKPLTLDINFDIENNATTTNLKDISFASDNILSAIQKICDTYDVEFKRHDEYIEIVDMVGEDSEIMINAGVESKKIVKTIDASNIVTKIYPVGSSQNLPSNYYYKQLRISQFDIDSGTHSGDLLIENSKAIEKYGIIEQTIEFPKVAVKSKKGTIQDSGKEVIGDTEYIYIYSDDFAYIDEEKVKSLTLLIIDGLKMAELPVFDISNDDKKIWVFQTLQDGSTISWLPSVGSSYTIVGYITQTDMNNARLELFTKATKYLFENAEPKITYEVNSIYIQEKEFEVGDKLALNDFKQNINTKVRVIEIQKDLVKNLYLTVKFSNKIEKLPYEFVKTLQETKEKAKDTEMYISNIRKQASQIFQRYNITAREFIEFEKYMEENGNITAIKIANLMASLNELMEYEGTLGLEWDVQNNIVRRLNEAVDKTAGTDFDNYSMYGGRKRCILTDDGIRLAYYGEDGYTETGKLEIELTVGGTTYPVGTPVQVMVEQPVFWYKTVPFEFKRIPGQDGVTIQKVQYYISGSPWSGYKRHPAFYTRDANRTPVDRIYLSAYEGCAYDTSAGAYITNDAQIVDFNNDKLSSIANVKPISGYTQQCTRPNSRKIANNRGPGWQLDDIFSISATQLLFAIEYGTFDSQSAIGKGVVEKESGSGNNSEPTGATSSLGNASGMASGTNGLVSVSYRGQENLWGNIWTYEDGLTLYSDGTKNKAYISFSDFTEETISEPYFNIEFDLGTFNDFVGGIGWSEICDFAFLATESSNEDPEKPLHDFYLQSVKKIGYKISYVGGCWNNTNKAGIFNRIVYDPDSWIARNNGARVIFVPGN